MKTPEARELFVDNGESMDQATPVVVVDGETYAFPGCCRIRIDSNEIEDYDGRIEFWDGPTETALMVRSPTSPLHERPTMRLAGLAERIAATRGAYIEVLGASDLLLRGAAGNRHRILQADQVVYTDLAAKLPAGNAVEVGAGELPDVVLEVDLTTDVRRGKLGLYEKWGFARFGWRCRSSGCQAVRDGRRSRDPRARGLRLRGGRGERGFPDVDGDGNPHGAE